MLGILIDGARDVHNKKCVVYTHTHTVSPSVGAGHRVVKDFFTGVPKRGACFVPYYGHFWAEGGFRLHIDREGWQNISASGPNMHMLEPDAENFAILLCPGPLVINSY